MGKQGMSLPQHKILYFIRLRLEIYEIRFDEPSVLT